MIFKNKIVCLCGSTRFKKEFEQAQLETFHGLHRQKIKMSSEVLVISPGDYIGESTAKEIEYAKSLNKIIRYLKWDWIYKTP